MKIVSVLGPETSGSYWHLTKTSADPGLEKESWGFGALRAKPKTFRFAGNFSHMRWRFALNHVMERKQNDGVF